MRAQTLCFALLLLKHTRITSTPSPSRSCIFCAPAACHHTSLLIPTTQHPSSKSSLDILLLRCRPNAASHLRRLFTSLQSPASSSTLTDLLPWRRTGRRRIVGGAGVPTRIVRVLRRLQRNGLLLACGLVVALAVEAVRGLERVARLLRREVGRVLSRRCVRRDRTGSVLGRRRHPAGAVKRREAAPATAARVDAAVKCVSERRCSHRGAQAKTHPIRSRRRMKKTTIAPATAQRP